MGRHAADEGVAADPIVEAALRHRPEGQGPRHGAPVASDEGPLGWPGDPADGTGLGWPADTRSDAAVTGEEPSGGQPDARPRSGWRRLFGSRAA